MIDLSTHPIWVGLLLGWFLMNTRKTESGKLQTMAFLNLSFIAWLFHPGFALAIAFGVFLLVKLLNLLKRQDSQVATRVSIILGVATLVLFVEIPNLAVSLTLGGLRQMLMGIGFSYILLRLIELIRYSWENPELEVSWPQVVAYLLPFHMLAAGPIQRFKDFLGAISEEPVSQEQTIVALERISSGLFKKFVIAESLQKLCMTGFQHPEPAYLFLEVQLNYIWLFLDFSAYSDVAVGAGLLLGYKTPENFNNPLLATNLIDLWERWHISLSQFIKFNLFLPLQIWLARRFDGRFPLWTGSLSFVIAFLLCGLWHKVSLLFVAWGLMHGIGLAVCKIYQNWAYRKFGKKKLKKSVPLRVISTILTFEFVALSWMLVSEPQVIMSLLTKLLS